MRNRAVDFKNKISGGGFFFFPETVKGQELSLKP
jgi:hypothetical protein